MSTSIDGRIHVEYGKMSGERVNFTNAHAWRDAAMRRSSDINVTESNQRRAAADAYNREQSISSPDMLADQQLYIQGKMDLEEYQKYLLFKHSTVATRK
jgi:hypothetical protein